MRRSLIQLLVLVLVFYGGLCLAAFLFQERLVYFPSGPPEVTPDAFGLAYEELELETADGVHVAGWWLPAAGEARGALLVCHGNAGNIAHRLLLARSFLDMGLSVLLFDYRGYGASGGRPSEEGTYLDAVAAYEHARARGFAPERIAAYGESLGGAVAIELALRRPLAALVVESAFTSLADVGRVHYPWLPVRWLCRLRYANEQKLAALTARLLVVHSPADELVPFDHARRLVAALPGAELLETRGGHNDGGHLLEPQWRERIERFLLAALGN